MTIQFRQHLSTVPTPLTGLALGIASLGWCAENLFASNGQLALLGAGVATLLLLLVVAKYCCVPARLLQDLQQPILGSVLPTFTMATMVVSHALAPWLAGIAEILWCAAVVVHLLLLLGFVYYRSQHFKLADLLPSWFIPPIGIVVAPLTVPAVPTLQTLAYLLLLFGLVALAVMLPLMLMRLILVGTPNPAALPTLAVLAAPASLCLAGYLSFVATPSIELVALLTGIAILMTFTAYLLLTRLLTLPFSPSHAAFTFPLVIGASAQFKLAVWLTSLAPNTKLVAWVEQLATVEFFIAAAVIAVVSARYALTAWRYFQLHMQSNVLDGALP
ncbi:TDT family transporter [Pseudoalteromonas fenneropenaei]|uniref:TDT family transporter n=1 Tax=Pseudoalteromonas fenneropenaei TaxID=1737459 RepID=A0ABV7CQ86_9GAMM